MASSTRVIPRRAVQLPPKERKGQLLQCAIGVFAELGIGSAGHAQVAKAAGVAVPTVFSYFPTRSSLVHAVLEEVERHIFAILREFQTGKPELTTFDKLYGILLAYADLIDTHPDLVKIFLNWSTSFQPDLEPLFHIYLGKVIRILEGIVREGQRNGEFGKDVDARDAAFIIQGSGNLIAHLKFSKYKSTRLTKYLVDLVRGALHVNFAGDVVSRVASSRTRPKRSR